MVKRELYHLLLGLFLLGLLASSILLISEVALSDHVADQLYQFDIFQDHHSHELYMPTILDR